MQAEYRISAEKTWDAIAESFDTTRRKPWKQCLDFMGTLKDTDVVADVGCGNGRNLFACATFCHHAIGVDISSKLLGIILKKLHEKNLMNVSLIHADAVWLPFQTNTVDSVLCIASLHNISGKKNRIAALQEVYRTLKPNGSALISVWSRWQGRYLKYFMKQSIIRSRQFGDIDISWRQHSLNVPRFYHLYSKREFLQELQSVGFHIKKLESVKIHSKRFADNYFALVQKR
jgi:alkylated DNA repair protein alkB family protein 8